MMRRSNPARGALALAVLLAAGCIGQTGRRRGPGTREAAVEHYQRALEHLQKQDIDRAIVAVRRAIDADPAKAVYHRLYGNLLAQKGRFVEAEMEYRLAVTRDPYDDESWNGLIQVVRKQGQRERVPAIIRQRVRIDPLDPEWRLRLGLACEEVGDLVLAERELRAAANLAEGKRAAYAHARLGIVYEALGKDAAALREYRESLKLDPDQVQVRRFVERLQRELSTGKPPAGGSAER